MKKTNKSNCRVRAQHRRHLFAALAGECVR